MNTQVIAAAVRPIEMIASTIDVYPKMGFRAPLAMMSDAIPMAGRIRM